MVLIILVPRFLKEMHETQKDDGKRSYEINPQLKVVYQILTSTQLILFNWVGPALIGNNDLYNNTNHCLQNFMYSLKVK